jgi:hypothetical protein
MGSRRLSRIRTPLWWKSPPDCPAHATGDEGVKAVSYLGFDTYKYPGDEVMRAWRHDDVPYEGGIRDGGKDVGEESFRAPEYAVRPELPAAGQCVTAYMK